MFDDIYRDLKLDNSSENNRVIGADLFEHFLIYVGLSQSRKSRTLLDERITREEVSMKALQFDHIRKTVWIHSLIASVAIVIYAPSSHGQSSNGQKMLKLQVQAERGSLASEIELAGRYLMGKGVTKDVALAAHWYEKAAETGNSDAQNQIGYLFQTGTGVSVDLVRALHWFQLAAASGSAAGKLNLALIYTEGLGVPKDIPFAMQLFEEGALKGDGTAAAYLGQIYYFGLAGSRDVNAAEKWLELGAKLHDPLADYNLGALYSGAPDHLHDFRKAANLLRRSSESGYIPAMHSLGLLLVNHTELEQTPHEAVTWLEAAMAAGQWKSAILLGILARDGKGISVDKKSALYHFLIAALQGGEEAEHETRHDIEMLSGEMAPDERAALVSAAQIWYMKHGSTQGFVVKEPATAQFFPLPSSLSAH
jgi:TPR repeat protein